MLESFRTNQFKKEFALAERRGKNMDKLIDVMGRIINEQPLSPRCRNHELQGNWAGKSECHIEGDWVLIYRIDPAAKTVTFHRTGTHSDLFKK